MANTITAFKPNPKKPSQGFVKVDVDGTEIELWTPEIDKVEPLNGKEIPSDWKVDVEQKRLLPPRQQGQGSYRNTKEAFELEQAGRRRWQEIEEEKKDRRTALMQAVEHAEALSLDGSSALRTAELFYDWLRESSPAGSDEPKASAPVGDPTSPAAGPAAPQPAAGVATTEERPRTPPQAGASTSVAAEREELGLDPDETPAASGEVAARPEPGEGSVKTSPGSTTCTHRYPSGRWLPTKVVDGQARCPRCGESAIKYREAS